MVIGILKIERYDRVENNPFYGNYDIKETLTRELVNERYDGLVSPKKGILITTSYNGEVIKFLISRHYFTGEPKDEVDRDTTFTASFYYAGNVYEATVDIKGKLVSFDEWLDKGDYEDDALPDNHYTEKDVNDDVAVGHSEFTGFKWESVDM